MNRVLEKYVHVGVHVLSLFSHLCFGVTHEQELVAYVHDADLCLQICQTHADTPVRPVAERQKRVRLDLVLVFGQEAAITDLDSCTLLVLPFRLELVWFRPVLFRTMNRPNAKVQPIATFDTNSV